MDDASNAIDCAADTFAIPHVAIRWSGSSKVEATDLNAVCRQFGHERAADETR
jgi:hypothetical protein